MLKNLLKIREKKGTALITALLVMGVLTAVSLGVSALIIREIGITKLAMDYGKAYYSAEGGLEMALLKLDISTAGTDFSGELPLTFENGGKAKFDIKNTSNMYPFFDEGKYDVDSADASAFYATLDVGQSVSVPLFAGDGEDGKVGNFILQFYAKFSNKDLKVKTRDLDWLSTWDVLRWKIYGLRVGSEGNKVTESINDFTGVTVINNGSTSGGRLEDNSVMTNADSPTWFGSVDCTGFASDDAYSYGGKIKCLPYRADAESVTPVVGADNSTQLVYTGCDATQAREYYYYDPVTGDNVVKNCYGIKDFLDKHTYNYLTLTNMMNPAVFKDDYEKDQRMKLSRLYFRILAENPFPKEVTEITSTGESGDSNVQLSIFKKRDSYLPVFNFALYHTAGDNTVTR